MANHTNTKHFLDTSVARPVITSSRKYQSYFNEYFGTDSMYVSPYVQMEFVRSLISKLVDFYFTLDMPNMDTIGDAFSLWSDKFRTSELKAVIQLASELIGTRGYDLSDPKDKPKALRAIAQVVERLVTRWKYRFKNVGIDNTRCERALIAYRLQGQAPTREMLERFQTDFNDVKRCRGRCRIDLFFLKRHTSMEHYITYASQLSNPTRPENFGFTKIAEKLKGVLQENRMSCSVCEKIGDAVIALEAPNNMQLEHTDHSFDHLCDVIGQPHYKHPSQTMVTRNSN